MKRLRQKELYFEQQQEQHAAAAAIREQQQQDEALPPPAAEEAEQLRDEDMPALEEQEQEEEDDNADFNLDHESDPMDHVEGETEQLAVMLVGFVEARQIVTEMNANGHDVGKRIH
jgi:hypothetical protein